MENCPILTSSVEKMVCIVIVGHESFVAMNLIMDSSFLDLKRVIYEVLCHVIQGNLKHDDVISLLSDVAVSLRLIANTMQKLCS